MRQSYHQLLNINDLKNSRNDRNEIKVLVKIPVPARFRARDRKEFLRNFEPSLLCRRSLSSIQDHLKEIHTNKRLECFVIGGLWSSKQIVDSLWDIHENTGTPDFEHSSLFQMTLISSTMALYAIKMRRFMST
jgi:hypothetical protein